MKPRVNIFWFRRDLRLHDNTGLCRALTAGLPVVPLFIFDRHILDELDDRTDRRVEFIHLSLQKMQQTLMACGATLEVRYGFPEQIFKDLATEYEVENVFTNHDYEPYALQRDAAVSGLLKRQGTGFHSFKDQVIFEKNEILNDNGKPYTVFTPYARKWKSLLNEKQLSSFPSEKYMSGFFRQPAKEIPSLAQMNFKATGQVFPPAEWHKETLLRYKEQRDYPALEGTTRLSVHLRFGTISIRTLARDAGKLSETFLNELIWREFYQMILWHFPHVVSRSFKPEYDKIQWRNNEQEFEAWCAGKTGYPMVDAGMRQLNATGYMHNRVRMITASFLTKHLLIDWRRGEAYFANKLLDYDLAANNGGWQWAAGSGCDAAPYFRIFNPSVQAKKFDPAFTYIQKWVPEWKEATYPPPIIEHNAARKRCLEVFRKALNEKKSNIF